jgi:hypothetical protein
MLWLRGGLTYLYILPPHLSSALPLLQVFLYRLHLVSLSLPTLLVDLDV